MARIVDSGRTRAGKTAARAFVSDLQRIEHGANRASPEAAHERDARLANAAADARYYCAEHGYVQPEDSLVPQCPKCNASLSRAGGTGPA